MANDLLVELLKDIQATTPRMDGHIPDGLPYIEIDLDRRLIKLTSDFDPLLIVGDHYASRIWFKCARHFDTVDLYDMTVAILYKNAAGNYRIAPVHVMETAEEDGISYIYFSWEINGEAAVQAGKIEFAVRFFSIDPVTNRMLFSLNTETCVGTVGTGLGHPSSENDKNYGYPSSDVEDILSQIDILKQMLDDQSIQWWDLEPEKEEEEG